MSASVQKWFGRASLRVQRITEIAARHRVSVKAAALQFSLAHPVATAAVPGSTRASRIAEDLAAVQEDVAAAFWADMREARLVRPAAPRPGGA
jgi:D-threo-aldose 1-dehydrogenase